MKPKNGYNDRMHVQADARRKQIEALLRSMSMREVATLLGITRQRVHQIVGRRK